MSATPPSNLNTLFFLSKPFVLLLNLSPILSLPKQYHQFSISSISKMFVLLINLSLIFLFVTNGVEEEEVIEVSIT